MSKRSNITINCAICNQEIKPTHLELCEECERQLKQRYFKIFEHQPDQKRNVDQFPMDFESIIYQNLFLKQSYFGNTAVFFGGYDGVGLFSTCFGEKDVLVFDLIPEVLTWWEREGEEFGFDVGTILYDVREPISDEICDSINSLPIDLWRTDPPYNCAGMFCFLTRIFYLNNMNSPIFLTLPSENRWSQLLKHNVWKFLSDSGMNITDVSPHLYNYLHLDGPDSFAWKVEVDSPIKLIPNVLFTDNIYSPDSNFANSTLGCKQYELCLARREEWDKKRDVRLSGNLNL